MTCTDCQQEIDNEWPGDKGPICQDCWEAQCDREWWGEMEIIARDHWRVMVACKRRMRRWKE